MFYVTVRGDPSHTLVACKAITRFERRRKVRELDPSRYGTRKTTWSDRRD